MTERLIIVSIVLLVSILAIANISMTEAQVTEGRLFVSGYIDDNEDYNDPMCRSTMTAVAQPGNRVIGRGIVNKIKYSIEFQPGWEQSSSIQFMVYDVGPVFCTSIPTARFTQAINGQISIDVRCGFQSYNCFYYVEYDHIEEQAEKYWSKLPYIGRKRVYR